MRAVTTQGPDFTTFAGTSALRLRRTAYGMCRDWHLAQDLTQVTLTKLYVSWGRAGRAGDIDAYAYTTLRRTYLDHRRRRSTAELCTGSVPEGPARCSGPELRLALQDALDRLPTRDRAILILRYWEDCTVERVAERLGVPVSVVKSQTRRSLMRLRGWLATERHALLD